MALTKQSVPFQLFLNARMAAEWLAARVEMRKIVCTLVSILYLERLLEP